ncbi:hypothetical protein O3P69_018069 [Scylla paramamosain]|uniref:Exosome complex component CSL4 n=1 Tax=Scylla paramamosain TaxID=85552 RepID=A0AAW0THJ5_SCYPA
MPERVMAERVTGERVMRAEGEVSRCGPAGWDAVVKSSESERRVREEAVGTYVMLMLVVVVVVAVVTSKGNHSEEAEIIVCRMKNGNGHILCVPGQRLCEASSSHVGGEGTYTFNKYIYASLIGRVVVEPQRDLHIVKVTSGQQGTVMPEAGSIVTCRVLSVNPSQATVSIICGTVRKQNVRDHQIDTVEMYNCFRPDDIILAVVMSLGDLRNYELSTARSELGVVTAHCEEGHPLVPASWTTMKCKCRMEKRKVAKVMPPKT